MLELEDYGTPFNEERDGESNIAKEWAKPPTHLGCESVQFILQIYEGSKA